MKNYLPLAITLLFALLVLPLLAKTSRAASPSKPDAPARGYLLVANKGDHTLGIIDPEEGKQVAAIDEHGVTGHEVTASPDGRLAYVPIYGNSGVGSPGTDGRTIAVIDIANHQLLKTLDLDKPLRPHCPVFGPQNGMLYVTTELGDSITEIDPQTLRIIATIPTGQSESHMMAITRDGQRAYTANVHVGTVSAIDLQARKTLAVIPICKQTQRIALSVDDRWAFTADQEQPRLAAINTETNKVQTWIPLPAVAYGTAPTLDGRWLLVTLPSAGKVAVVDLTTMKVARTVAVPKSPQEILVRPDDQVAYVSCHESKKVAAINLQTWQVEKLIEAGPMADGLAWAKVE